MQKTTIATKTKVNTKSDVIRSRLKDLITKGDQEKDMKKLYNISASSAKLLSEHGTCFSNKTFIKWLRGRATAEISNTNSNNSFSQYVLGQLYHRCIIPDTINNNNAILFYEMSVKNHNTFAMNTLGTMYQGGHGVKKNYAEAKRLYELSSALGNRNALNNLARLYASGIGVEKDLAKAAELCKKAVDLGSRAAWDNMKAMMSRVGDEHEKFASQVFEKYFEYDKLKEECGKLKEECAELRRQSTECTCDRMVVFI